MFNSSPNLVGTMLQTTISDQELQNRAPTPKYYLLAGTNAAAKGTQHSIKHTPITEGFNVNEAQPTLNHQAPQQSSKRTGEGDVEASRRNEPMARARGQVIKGAHKKWWGQKLLFRTGRKVRKRGVREKLPPEEKAKERRGRCRSEAREAEGAAPSRAEGTRQQQPPTTNLIPVREMGATGNYSWKVHDTKNGYIWWRGNPREHVLNYKTFMELQTHSDVLMCKIFLTTLTSRGEHSVGSVQNQT